MVFYIDYVGYEKELMKEFVEIILFFWFEDLDVLIFLILVVLGGDGILYNVINLLFLYDLVIFLSYILCGFGNDFVWGVGLLRNIDKVLY